MLAALIVLGATRTYFVAPDGSDKATGTSARAPFATLRRVKEELAKQKDNLGVQVVITGRIRQLETVEFGSEANGVTFVGKGKESVISGGTVLPAPDQTELSTVPIHRYSIKNLKPFRQVFTEEPDRRLPRTHLPKSGFYNLTKLEGSALTGPWNEGQDRAYYRTGDIKQWDNLRDVDLIAHHYWVTSILPIKAISPSLGLVEFGKKSVFRLSDDYTGQAAPYILENVPEALDEPGSWYTNSQLQQMTVRAGDSAFKIVVPQLDVLLRIKGASKVTLRGITFMHNEWNYGPNQSGDAQAAVGVPGAVQIVDSRAVALQQCQFRELGTYGVEVTSTSEGTDIDHCKIEDVGGGGVKVGHGTSWTTISDCTIRNGGIVFAPAVGIWIGNSGHNRIVHNLIENLYYTGISVGWTWGYGPSDAIDNLIEGNVIQHLGKGVLSDMGGIYTLGVSPGTVLRGNRIDDIQARGYGGWGIYFDEGSTGILAENNVVTNCKTGLLHQHYGKENIVRNNIFAFSQTGGQLIRTRKEDHLSFTLERNIIYWNGSAPALGGNWEGDGFKLFNNLFWKQDGVQPPIANNLIADPLFIDPKHGDFKLRSESPAKKIGFRPIDLSEVGPRKIRR